MSGHSQFSEAFNVLQDIRATTLHHASALPRKGEVQAQWQGLGFCVGGVRLVAKVGDVSELLKQPRITALPGVKSWVLGLANVRGRLLTVVDLHDFLQLPLTTPLTQARVLVVEHGELVAGLMVEQSLGIQHFSEESFEPLVGRELAGLGPYIDGAFRHGGRLYHQISLKNILSDQRFFAVAQTNVDTSNADLPLHDEFFNG